MVEMDGTQIRGVALRGIIRYVKMKRGFLGAQGIDHVVEKKCPPEVYTNPEDIVDSEWYPMEYYIPFLRCAANVVGPSKEDRFVEMGRFNATNMSVLASYSESRKHLRDLADRLPRTWAHLHKGSELQVLESTVEGMLLGVDNCPEEEEICRYFQGFFEGLAALTKTDAQVESKGYSGENGGSWKYEIIYST